jgi:signal transduction histidine kinase/DNA-binding response OmpR family regulator/HPt (histidine-containing phosphotransfer) domain-containing protein
MNKKAPRHLEQQLLQQQELITDISRLFIENSETDAMIVQALQMTGEFLGLSRVMLLDYRQQSLHCQYEWYEHNGLVVSKLGVVKPLEDAEAQMLETLARRGISCYKLDETASEDIILRYEPDTVARLFLTVFCENDFWGLLEFDRYADNTPWTESDTRLGKIVATILSLAISCRNREDRLQKSLLEAEQATDKANQAKVDFLSRMSHEMRTPMNAIIGMTDIALCSKNLDKMEYCLNQIDNASKHLLNVINDILDMSKMETKKLVLSLDEFDFEQALMGIIDFIQSLAEEKRQDLIINIDPHIPRSLIGDELRIGQVIFNLLNNAIKFTPDGGEIKLNISQLAAEGDLLTLQVEVIDNGVGIPETQQARLFSYFEQADGSTTRKYGGTGLGLAICKHVVNLMGGDIRVQSSINQGAAFIFTMKLQKGKRQLNRRLSSNISRSEIRILAVDDSSDIRKYFLRIMSALDLPCDVAADGTEALAMIEACHDKLYNVFFVDQQMPGMDGIELTKQIRSRTGCATVIIMTSSSPWNEIEQAAVAAGVSLFIPKPLFPSTIINGINECLGVAAKDKSAAKKAVLEGGYNFKNHRLLLAEDVPVNREIIHILLSDTQIGIDNAVNGRQALEMFEQNPQKYNIILMDMHMPDMDGYEATCAIRALPCKEGKTIPIIAMTANVLGDDDMEKCFSADISGHIGKPIEVKRLLDVLAGYLQPLKTPQRAVEKKEDSYKPISYIHNQEGKSAEAYTGFIPLIDVMSGLKRVMNNKTLYFTLLHNFSGRALADEMIAHIKNNDFRQTEQKAHAIRSMAANLGLSELLKVINDIEGHAKMKISSAMLINKLDETITRTLSSIKQLLEGEGVQ